MTASSYQHPPAGGERAAGDRHADQPRALRAVEPRDDPARLDREPRLRLVAHRRPGHPGPAAVQGVPAPHDRRRGACGPRDPPDRRVPGRPRARPFQQQPGDARARGAAAHRAHDPDRRRRREGHDRDRAGRRDADVGRPFPVPAGPRSVDHRRPRPHHRRRIRLGRRDQPGVAPVRDVRRHGGGAGVRRLGGQGAPGQPAQRPRDPAAAAVRHRPARDHHRADRQHHPGRQVPDDLPEPPAPDHRRQRLRPVLQPDDPRAR